MEKSFLEQFRVDRIDREVELKKCCGVEPEIFEMRPGDWTVHCCRCWDGTDPYPTQAEAIAAWQEM